MPKKDKEIYDAVIIGAGIGGLVCGCYLAKAGMKVLILEQHFKPGGYCTSFQRKGFIFDAAAHSLGGFRYGNVGNILRELQIDEKIKIVKKDPSDIVFAPDYKISFWSDLDKTIQELQQAFPRESGGIKALFYFLVHSGPNLFISTRSKTFKELLDSYVKEDKLKAILSLLLLGTGGLPHSKMSAFFGMKIFREFILDGGYYPEGGMQTLSDSFAARFRELGGELRLSCRVKKMKVADSTVKGIIIENGNFIPSKYVISNCDARQTFLNLLGKDKIDPDFLVQLRRMVPTLSGFILYLLVKKGFMKTSYDFGSNLWYLFDYNVDKLYNSIKRGKFDSIGWFVLHIYPDGERIFAFMNAPFKNWGYWNINKSKISHHFLKTIESRAIPGLSKYVIHEEAATPFTLQRYTSNYRGATFGWAGTPSQLADHDFKKPSFLRNLYLTGHWTTHGLGIPGVAYVGHDVASSILRRKGEER
jgi:phytoene dehydrogenase-like protein